MRWLFAILVAVALVSWWAMGRGQPAAPPGVAAVGPVADPESAAAVPPARDTGADGEVELQVAAGEPTGERPFEPTAGEATSGEAATGDDEPAAELPPSLAFVVVDDA
jgi:hypothetical protein